MNYYFVKEYKESDPSDYYIFKVYDDGSFEEHYGDGTWQRCINRKYQWYPNSDVWKQVKLTEAEAFIELL